MNETSNLALAAFLWSCAAVLATLLGVMIYNKYEERRDNWTSKRLKESERELEALKIRLNRLKVYEP